MILAYILIFTFIGSVASLAGSFLLVFKKSFSEDFSVKLINFAAGVLIAVAFLDLLPEAVETANGSNIFIFTLGGFVGFFMMERFLHLFHYHHGHGEHHTNMLVLFGDSVHNFIDGVAIAAGFLTNTSLGISTSLAVAAHEVPQEIADMGILLSNGLSKSKALLYNFLSALTALAGALLAYYFSSVIENNEYIFLSITAGLFIYISASDLIPQLHEEYLKRRKFFQTFVFLSGIVSVLIFTAILN